MAISFEFNPSNPTQTLDDIISHVELLADCFGFSNDHFSLSEQSITALADTLGAISKGLRAVSKASRKPFSPDLRVV